MLETEKLTQLVSQSQNLSLLAQEENFKEALEAVETKKQLQEQLEQLGCRLEDNFHRALKQIAENDAVKAVLKSSPLGIFCGRRPKLLLAAITGLTLMELAKLVLNVSGSALIQLIFGVLLIGGSLTTGTCFSGWLVGIRLRKNGSVHDYPCGLFGYKPSAKVWLLERVQSGVSRAVSKFISRTESANFALRQQTEKMNYFCEVLQQFQLTGKDQNQS